MRGVKAIQAQIGSQQFKQFFNTFVDRYRNVVGRCQPAHHTLRDRTCLLRRCGNDTGDFGNGGNVGSRKLQAFFHRHRNHANGLQCTGKVVVQRRIQAAQQRIACRLRLKRGRQITGSIRRGGFNRFFRCFIGGQSHCVNFASLVESMPVDCRYPLCHVRAAFPAHICTCFQQSTRNAN